MSIAEDIARRFHATYERLAPELGYTTREASAVPWPEVPEKNRKLMIATVQRLLDRGVIAQPLPAQRWNLRPDDDGHWYLVPYELDQLFEAYVYEDGDYPEGVITVNGAPSRVTFSAPELDGERL